LPRTAATQALAGRALERDTAQLRPGDLLTFGRGQRVTHIGIYAGRGRFIHASSAGRSVVESLLRPGNWYARHWLGARRIVAEADPSP
jgi:cell wall-associated NlpC family hydrolase